MQIKEVESSLAIFENLNEKIANSEQRISHTVNIMRGLKEKNDEKKDGEKGSEGELTPEEKKEAIEAVKEARAQGDLSENFEYYAAKKDKNKNESRIRYLERMLKTAEKSYH